MRTRWPPRLETAPWHSSSLRVAKPGLSPEAAAPSLTLCLLRNIGLVVLGFTSVLISLSVDICEWLRRCRLPGRCCLLMELLSWEWATPASWCPFIPPWSGRVPKGHNGVWTHANTHVTKGTVWLRCQVPQRALGTAKKSIISLFIRHRNTQENSHGSGGKGKESGDERWNKISKRRRPNTHPGLAYFSVSLALVEF